MGGPQNKDEIHPYLKELFQDRELLKLPFQKILSRFIAWRRTPKIQERYEEIGQYSPTKKIMDEQCAEITKKLDIERPQSAPHLCLSGFPLLFSQNRRNDQKTSKCRKDYFIFTISTA